jgi:hypothetical protein
MLRLISVSGLGHLLTARTTPFAAKRSEPAVHADPAAATPERIEHALAIVSPSRSSTQQPIRSRTC